MKKKLNYLKQNRFVKNSIILIVGGFLSKLIAMVTKIINARLIGTDGVALHALVIPTYQLLINIAMLGIPIAIAKIIAEKKYRSKKIIFSLIPISLTMSIVLIILVYFSLPIITKALHEPKAYYPLLAVSLILPFVSISSIVRSYFFGKQQMMPHVVSIIFEQLIRLIIIIIITPYLMKFGIVAAVLGIFLVNVISELASILILYKYLPKNFSINKADIVPDKTIIKDAMDVGFPATTSNLIHSIGYFFEPIILISVLVHFGASASFLKYEYGIINGYVFTLLLIPSFFSLAISKALLPTLAEANSKGNFSNIKTKTKQGLLISFGLGFIATTLFMAFPEFFLKIIFNTTKGASYLRLLAPFFLFQYLQTPLVSVLQAINKNKIILVIAIVTIIVKYIIFILCTCLGLGFNSYLIAISVNILFVTAWYALTVRKFFKDKEI